MRLNKVKKTSKNFFVKIVFSVLALSFIISSVSSLNNKSNHDIAWVNKKPIALQEFLSEFNSQKKYLQSLGYNINNDLLINIKRHTLNQLIEQKLLSAEAENLGIVIGNNIVIDLIRQFKPDFFDQQGLLNKEQWNEFLHQQNINENTLITKLKQQFKANFLLQNFNQPKNLNNFIANQLSSNDESEYNSINANAKIFVIKNTNKLPNITKTEIEEYYKKHQKMFQNPEKREISFITLNKNHFLNQNKKIKQNDIKLEYENNKDSFFIPETRNLYNFIFKTQEEAEKSRIKLLKSNSPNKAQIVTNHINKISYAPDIKPNTLEKELNDFVFKAKVNDISLPIQTSFGWHIVILDKINLARLKTFDEAKNEIEQELRSNLAEEQLQKSLESIEENLNYGKPIEEISKIYQLKITNLPPYSKTEILKDQQSEPITHFIEEIYSEKEKYTSSVNYNEHSGEYVIYKVNKIIVSDYTPITEAADTISNLINAQNISKNTDQLLVQLNQTKLEKNLNKQAINKKLKSSNISIEELLLTINKKIGTNLFELSNSSNKNTEFDIPQDFIKTLMQTKIGEPSKPYKIHNNLIAIGVLSDITSTKNTDQASEYVAKMSEQIFYHSLYKYLYKKYKVKINDKLFDQITSN